MDITLKIRLAYDYLNAGKIEQSLEICKEILADNPFNPYILEFIGIILHKKGDLDSAIEYIKKAVDLNPVSSDTILNLGTILMEKQRYNEAAEYFKKVLSLTPESIIAKRKLGIVLMKTCRFSEAVTIFENLTETNPTYENYFDLAIAYYNNNQINNAIESFKKVILLNPDCIDAYINLEFILKVKGMHEEAKYYHNLITEKNKRYNISSNLSINTNNILIEKWIQCMSSFPIIYSDENEILEVRNKYSKLLYALSETVFTTNINEIKVLNKYIGEYKPFYLPYQGYDDKELQEIYGNIVHRVVSSTYPYHNINNSKIFNFEKEKIRIGFVSGYFYYHSVWKIPIKGWIENLNKKKLTLYGYYTGNKKDEETNLAQKYFDYFIEGLHDFDSLSRKILEDCIDILIYPEIGMDSLSLKLASVRLAPVQCASWGHPETTGLPTIDYFLSGELLETINSDNHYTESLIRLPNLSIFYNPPKFQEIDMTRESFGLRNSSVLYHCCQALYKFLPQHDDIFPKIAKEVGDCQFLFSSFPFVTTALEKFRLRLYKAFQKYKLNADKFIVFLPLLNPLQYHALNRLSDIFLDSVGWSGCNSVLEALSCNLPVITLPGDLMRSREGTAILNKIGLVTTIAKSKEDYITLAVNLGNNRRLREEISEEIAKKFYLACKDKACVTALEDFFIKVANNSLLKANDKK